MLAPDADLARQSLMMRFLSLIPLVILTNAANIMAAEPPVRSLLEQRQSLVVTQHWDLSCGAAALATLLIYQHGLATDERSVAARLIDRPEYLANPTIIRARHGFSLLDMKRVAKSYGLEGEGFGQLEFDQLDELAPLIVRVDFSGFPHFVVYRGQHAGTVYLADPAFGQRSMSRARFEKAWKPDAILGRVGFRLLRSDGRTAPDRLSLNQEAPS